MDSARSVEALRVWLSFLAFRIIVRNDDLGEWLNQFPPREIESVFFGGLDLRLGDRLSMVWRIDVRHGKGPGGVNCNAGRVIDDQYNKGRKQASRKQTEKRQTNQGFKT